jgi:DNA-binding transcriptional ArsR family regulator
MYYEVAVDGYQGMAGLLRSLGHPVRLQILEALGEEGEACVSHLQHLLGYRQATISQQLALLRQAGIVKRRRQGLNIYYSHAVDQLHFFMADFIDATRRTAGVDNRTLRIERKERRPSRSCTCPKCKTGKGGLPKFLDILRERIVLGRRTS